MRIRVGCGAGSLHDASTPFPPATLRARRVCVAALLAAGAWAVRCAAAPAPPRRRAPAHAPCCGPITDDGRRLERLLDDSGVERLWLPHTAVDWFSGAPRASRPGLRPLASHCSAFAASIATRLREQLPHPPQYPQRLLANAQAQWLASPEARADGWREASLHEAQALANQGWLVLGAYANPDPRRPGHIAVVRPGLPDEQQLSARGPELTQAGEHNGLRVSTARGFAHHPGAWQPGGSGGLRWWAHAVDWNGLGDSAADSRRG